MSGGSSEGYRVRAAVFKGKGRVYHPAGSGSGSRRHGFSISAPPPFKPPKEQTWTVKTLEVAREKALALRLEFGDAVVISVEPIGRTPAEPRPVQTSLADLGDWPRQRR